MSQTVRFLSGTLAGGAAGAGLIVFVSSGSFTRLQQSLRNRVAGAWSAAIATKRERERELEVRYHLATEIGEDTSVPGRQ